MDERVLETSNPAGGKQLDKFTRELRLRRADEALTKAVKENNWKLADELEIKLDQELKRQQDQDAAHGPSIAEPATHPGGTLPTHTSDEYVEDPEEEMIRVIQHVANRYMPSTGKTATTRPPKRPRRPPTGYGGSNKKGNSGPRHGQAEGEPDPTRHGQLPPGPSSPIRPEPCPYSGRCRVCRKCYLAFASTYYDPNAIDCMFWDSDID